MMTEELGLSVTIDAELSRFERAMRDAGRLVETQTGVMDRGTKRAAQSFKQLEGALDPAARAAARLERDTAKVQRALEKGAVSAERAAVTQKRLNDQYEQTMARLNGVGRHINLSSQAIATGSKGMQRYGSVMQQAGYQIGDFAVQVASGQNAMVAMTQQGSQLLGAFGPWGAVLGAAGAVAGALAVGLFKAGDEAEKAAKETDKMTTAQKALEPLLTSNTDGVKELASKYSELSASMQAVERVSIAKALRENAAAMGELRDQAGKTIESTRESLEKLKNPLGEWSFGGPGGSEVTRGLEQALAAIAKFQAGGELPKFVAELEQIRGASEVAGSALIKLMDATDGPARAADDLVKKEQMLRDTLALVTGELDEAGKKRLGLAMGGKELTKEADEQARAWEELERKVARFREEAERTEKAQTDAARALWESVDPAYKYANEVERLTSLKPTLIELIGNEAKAQAVLNEAIREADPAYQQAQKAAEQLAREQKRAFEQYGREIGKSAEEYPAPVIADQEVSSMVKEALR